MNLKFGGTVLCIAITLVLGIILTLKEKPYNNVVSNIHRIAPFIVIAFSVILHFVLKNDFS